VLASITFGLFLSAIVPNRDVVLYFILVQLFVQIILSGALFPLPDNSVTNVVSKAVISHWTMDAMGSSVGMNELDSSSRVCVVAEMPGSADTVVRCDDAAVGNLGLNYERSPEHLLITWAGLFAQLLVWATLTIVVQMRRKGE
jgi:hypothetical protein